MIQTKEEMRGHMFSVITNDSERMLKRFLSSKHSNTSPIILGSISLLRYWQATQNLLLRHWGSKVQEVIRF